MKARRQHGSWVPATEPLPDERPAPASVLRPGIGRAEIEAAEREVRMRAGQQAEWERVRAELAAQPRDWDAFHRRAGAVEPRMRAPWRRGRLATYLSHTYDELRSLPGVGRAECADLIALLWELLQRAATADQQAVGASALRRLEAWGIPLDFPIELVAFSTVRVRGQLRKWNCQTLADILHQVSQLADRLGKTSGTETLALIDALAAGDADRVRAWIPFAESGRGLSFSRAMAHVIGRLPAEHREILEMRLVRGLSCGETGAAHGLGAARIHDLQRGFVIQVQRRVNYFFPPARRTRGPEQIAVADLEGVPSADEPLMLAALACARETPLDDHRFSPGPRPTYRPRTEE